MVWRTHSIEGVCPSGEAKSLGTGRYAQANLSGTSAPSSGLFVLTGVDVTNAGADNYGFYPIERFARDCDRGGPESARYHPDREGHAIRH